MAVTAQDVSDALKWTTNRAPEYRNAGSAAVAYFGFPVVAGFLSSPQFEEYATRYGLETERVWDALVDPDADEALVERTYAAMADWATNKRKVITLGEALKTVKMDGPPAHPGPSVDPAITGQFIDDDEGGVLVAPGGEEFYEEEVVCARADDIDALVRQVYGELAALDLADTPTSRVETVKGWLFPADSTPLRRSAVAAGLLVATALILGALRR